MSMKTLPLLFINLGGEMMYILDQRLKAQNIPADKAKKVMHDISSTMLNTRFMEELFKPQEQYSKKAMRTVFDRLAHASIMRLNPASMDKLYDLMTMAFKYQVSLCLHPKDILLVTLNHMDAIRVYVEGGSVELLDQVEFVYMLLIQNYGQIQAGEFMFIRQTLLNFFQDMHIRVSIFLKDKVQNTNGRFILPKGGELPTYTEEPGTIKQFDTEGKSIRAKQFHPGATFTTHAKEGSIAPTGDRVSKLGTNMYSVNRVPETTFSAGPSIIAQGSTIPEPCSVQAAAGPSAPEPDLSVGANPQAKQQLDLLSTLLTTPPQKNSNTDFRLNLFNTDKEEADAAELRPVTKSGSQIVTIDATKVKQDPELSKIMHQMKVDDKQSHRDDDLLDLMDASNK